MRRRLAVVALILLAALPIWAVAQEAVTYYTFGQKWSPAVNWWVGGSPRNYAALAAATNSDTISGPMVPVQNARRVMFTVISDTALAVDSLAYIQVTMKDTTEAELYRTSTYWTDANGLAGLTVVDNISSNNISKRFGGRTIELSAPGSGRIPWVYARPAIRMKCCANSKADSIRWFAQVQRD